MTPSAALDRRQTLMEQEAGEAAAAVAHMLGANRNAFVEIGRRLRASPPGAVVTCARGSSDHAATYAKYLIETMTGTPTASAALSQVPIKLSQLSLLFLSPPRSQLVVGRLRR